MLHIFITISNTSCTSSINTSQDAKKKIVDETTWNGHNYHGLLEGIWQQVAIHSNHQQRCENYVQMAALIAKTLVGEARRTWRAIIISTLIRRFNQWAVDKARAEEKEKVRKLNEEQFDKCLIGEKYKFIKERRIDRVNGSQRIKYFTQYIRKFLEDRKKMKNSISKADWNQIRDSIATTNNKVSADELRHKTTAFADSIKEGLRQYKAEQEKGYTMTADMGGKLLLSVLTAKDGYTDHMRAEFLARNLHTNEDFTKVYGNGLDTAEKLRKKKNPTINFTVLKAAVKKHECGLEVLKNTFISVDDALPKVKAITPQSNELKIVHDRQTEVIEELHLE